MYIQNRHSQLTCKMFFQYSEAAIGRSSGKEGVLRNNCLSTLTAETFVKILEKIPLKSPSCDLTKKNGLLHNYFSRILISSQVSYFFQILIFFFFWFSVFFFFFFIEKTKHWIFQKCYCLLLYLAMWPNSVNMCSTNWGRLPPF